MSTTVSYKGQTLTTVSNDTKTLLTEGKYLEDDLTLTDVSGSGATLITKNISENGTYNASSDSADGYSQVTVAVPASAVDTGTKSISTNGTHDVTGYASANVNVPNSYSQSDEGKVVSNGALVAQTAHADVTPTTSDQTIDTTTNDSIKVKGDADLVASNIKKDVEIFGVTGSYEGGGGGDDDLKKLLTNTLTSFSDSDITGIPAYAFYGKSALTNISIPNVTIIRDSSFYGTGLSGYLRLDKVTDVSGNGLDGTMVTGLELPALNLISWAPIFRHSSLLEKVRLGISSTALGSTNNCGDSWFRDCPKMDTLIIGYTNRIITLGGGVAAFNNTPFASNGTGGTLYVPQAMIASYESNTNWSTILSYTNNQILPIEGSAYENYYFDGTPIT